MDSVKCQCIKCGHTISSTTHCNALKCSECGGQMRRKDRPGPGMDNASYKVGDKIFVGNENIPDSPVQGGTMGYKGYEVELTEYGQYPIGTYGWWVKVLKNNSCDFIEKEEKRNLGKERYGGGEL